MCLYCIYFKFFLFFYLAKMTSMPLCEWHMTCLNVKCNELQLGVQTSRAARESLKIGSRKTSKRDELYRARACT
ncbi:hypothetical protein HanIR_Chr07g0338211 [Helianthus annuus]|nr:hypothetical protein HanIR_Chr07g0338211 [Helianthus annuus]